MEEGGREGGVERKGGRKEGSESRKKEERAGERTSVSFGLFSLHLNPSRVKMYLPVEV